MDKQGGRIVKTAVEARGGLLGRPVLAVLLVSLAELVTLGTRQGHLTPPLRPNCWLTV
jgi:hypothetical protein